MTNKFLGLMVLYLEKVYDIDRYSLGTDFVEVEFADCNSFDHWAHRDFEKLGITIFYGDGDTIIFSIKEDI